MNAKTVDIIIMTGLGFNTALLSALTNDDIYKYASPYLICYAKVAIISLNGGLMALKGARMLFEPVKPLVEISNETTQSKPNQKP